MASAIIYNDASAPQVLGRTKGTNNAPRRVLGDLTNKIVGGRGSKSVAFDATNKPGKKLNTPITSKQNPLKALTGKSNVKSVKINEFVIREDVTTKSKYDTPDSKEYMAPADKVYPRLPLPDYVRKACELKPTFNIDLTKHRHIIPLDEYVERGNKEYIKSHSCTSIVKEDAISLDDLLELKFDFDDELLLQIESDDSFSLELFDKECKEAGLEMPEW